MTIKLLTTQEAAKILRMSPQSLTNRRHLGLPPDYYKIGRSCRYSLESLIEYIEKHKIELDPS